MNYEYIADSPEIRRDLEGRMSKLERYFRLETEEKSKLEVKDDPFGAKHMRLGVKKLTIINPRAGEIKSVSRFSQNYRGKLVVASQEGMEIRIGKETYIIWYKHKE